MERIVTLDKFNHEQAKGVSEEDHSLSKTYAEPCIVSLCQNSACEMSFNNSPRSAFNVATRGSQRLEHP